MTLFDPKKMALHPKALPNEKALSYFLRPHVRPPNAKIMKNIQCILFALAVILATPLSLSASGSYCTCMPKPPAKGSKATKVDRAKYDLGQKAFNGKTAPVQGDATAQRARLEALQRKLPEKVGAKKDLTSLAGKLSEEQLDALEYFVQQRYPTTK